jgi:HSP20 family protein
MNRMFDEMLGGLATRSRSGGRQVDQTSQWAPALDVLQEDGDIVVRAELPGVKPENVDITLSRGVLTIQGERKAEQERQGSGYYVRERRYGAFRRTMQLPEGVDENSINARYENGVLEVRISGGATVQEPKRIQIQGATGEQHNSNGGGGTEGRATGS